MTLGKNDSAPFLLIDGTLASLTYPDGRTITYTYSAAQRPLTAVGSSGTNYAAGASGTAGATYWPQGALDQDVHGPYGIGGFAGVTETWSYDNDLEPTSIGASSSAGSALSLTYGFANNGSVTSISNANDTNRNESMTYDPLDRILQAQTAATSGQDCWGLNFGTGGLADDALGNLLSMGVFKCSGPSLSVSVNSKNQISSSGFSYDADGEMTNDANYTYAFNGASEITSANGVNYTYDGDGLRVAKSSGTLYWRAYTGQVIEETDTSGNATTDYIFFDGRRIAWWSSTGNSIENSGFESGNTDWSLGATYSIVDNASNAHSGSWYLSSSGSSNDQWAVATGTNGSAWVPVKPGQVITWGGWIKRTGGTGILDWGCETVDASYNLTGWCGHCEGPAVGTSNWQFFSASYVAPANAAYVRYFAELHGCGDPDTSVTSADFDDAFLNVGGVYYQFADALGSTRAVTDSSGNVCFSADYYPYGQENDYNTSCSPTYKFAGYEYDSETGNYYAYARYYNPRLGRFMSPDPLGGSVDDPQSLNGYSYVLNNPATLNDPLGLVAVCMVAGRGGQGDFAAGGGGGGLPNCDYGPTEGGGSWGGGGGSFYSGGGECSLDGGDVPCGELGSLAPPNSVYALTQCSDSASCAAWMLQILSQQILEEAEGPAGFWPGLRFPTPIGIGGPSSGETAGGVIGTCEPKILAALNSHFGTDFTPQSIGSGPTDAPFQWPQVPAGTGTVNLDILVPQQEQGMVSPGRYPVSWWTYLTGIGPTLHVVGQPDVLETPQTLAFSLAAFTVQLESAWPYNPLGFVWHFAHDVGGLFGHSPCP